jgi:hypothetical protein
MLDPADPLLPLDPAAPLLTLDPSPPHLLHPFHLQQAEQSEVHQVSPLKKYQYCFLFIKYGFDFLELLQM